MNKKVENKGYQKLTTANRNINYDNNLDEDDNNNHKPSIDHIDTDSNIESHSNDKKSLYVKLKQEAAEITGGDIELELDMKGDKDGYQPIRSADGTPLNTTPSNIIPIDSGDSRSRSDSITNSNSHLLPSDEYEETNVFGESKSELSWFKLIALCISFLGVQFGWALQIAFSTPLFLELGVPPFWVSFIWMAGPISGLIVQPIVGVISDISESKYGRRRPYIFFGSIFIVVGLLLISNAQSLGSIFGDQNEEKGFSIFLAIVGFWILDLSNNVVQAPCRALLVDVAPGSQQGIGSSLFSIMLGIGNLLGYLMGSLNLVKVLPFMKTDTRALFTISSITLITCISFTLCCIKEKQYKRLDNGSQNNINPFKSIWNGIKEMPVVISRVCCVQFFSWIGWFCFVLYATTWVGVDVYQGNPNAPNGSPEKILFQEGVRRGSLGLMISSGVSIATSLLIPALIRLIGIKYVYFFGNAIQTLTFALFFICRDKVSAMFLIGATGVPWSVVMVIPFTLVGMGITSSESGLHMGTLNVFVVIPQLLVSLGISFIITFFGGDVVYSLLTGSISSFIATCLVFRIIVPNQSTQVIINSV